MCERQKDAIDAVIEASKRLLRVLVRDGGYSLDPEVIEDLREIYGAGEDPEPQTSMLALIDALKAAGAWDEGETLRVKEGQVVTMAIIRY